MSSLEILASSLPTSGNPSSQRSEILAAPFVNFSTFVPQANKPNEFSDVVLVADGSRYHAHKLVLCSRSSYFKALFLNGMQETGCQEITLDIERDLFEVLLHWIYTNHLRFSQEPCAKLETSKAFKLWSVSKLEASLNLLGFIFLLLRRSKSFIGEATISDTYSRERLLFLEPFTFP